MSYSILTNQNILNKPKEFKYQYKKLLKGWGMYRVFKKIDLSVSIWIIIYSFLLIVCLFWVTFNMLGYTYFLLIPIAFLTLWLQFILKETKELKLKPLRKKLEKQKGTNSIKIKYKNRVTSVNWLSFFNFERYK